MQPLVTISIPLYNCEDFLPACLESVRQQSYSNLEVTLINDQTPDNSVKLAQDFIARHKLQTWKIIHLEKNSGLSVVRNKGIETATGKYVFFLDSDDQIMPDAIKLMVEFAEARKVQMVVGDVETVDVGAAKTSSLFSVEFSGDTIYGNGAVFRAYVAGQYPVTSWNKLFKRSFLTQNELYFTPNIFSEDELHSFKSALKLESVGFIHQPTYRYFLHSKSIIHNKSRKNFLDWTLIAREMDRILKEETQAERRKLMLQYLVHFKKMTLAMNWKAQKNETLWKESYISYKKLSSLTLADYLSAEVPLSLKKADLFSRLPTDLGFRFFRWRWQR
ncbi:glycosyltransferase [Kaistella sp. 97-N-M2]|uniref:glycosyltransferase family 2 protein n=1 Tax=Kaistella sp. 97-N-M2 TaxID=2908645 RepID=UPI001F3708C0|nr:glycosyltransferase [Kaistella sp. 97-N-M2]UJF30658.1 glycosyltransferase [Kaistella sp. 97-N-M2]